MTSFQDIKYQLNIKIIHIKPDLEPDLELYLDPDLNYRNILQFYDKFKYNHEGDCGIDLYNPDIEIESLMVGTIDFNIKCEMIDLETNNYTSYYLVPRSSLAKTSFQLANSIGIIDAGYRGSIMAKIRCFHKTSDVLKKGSYFQIIAPDLKPIKVNIVTELSTTNRNSGFGSTK